MLCPDGLLCLLNIEFHLVHFPEQIVGKFQVSLVDLIDQKHDLVFGQKGLTDFSVFDILMNIIDVGAELTVIQPLYHVVGVESVLGFCGGFDVPDQQLFAQRVGDGLSQHGLAGAGFALDQERLFQSHGDIDGLHQLFRCDVACTGFQIG